MALQAAENGAEVILIMGPSNLKAIHSSILQIDVKTAQEMQSQVQKYFQSSDIAIFSAAVSDYKTNKVERQKVKKSVKNWDITLQKTNDILLEVSQMKKENQILVGFALETENEMENATA